MTPRTLRLMLPLTAMLSLAACATGIRSEPVPVGPSQIVNPCMAIKLPARLDADRRARLVRELSEAPADAVWPTALVSAAGVEAAVRACQKPGTLAGVTPG
jgi:hypothetical protein